MCRPFSYYVNPDSEQIMELGTIEYPFKDINVVFTEIFNLHQHSNITINIFVMEATDNYLPFDLTQILNITQVNIESYTESDYYEPRYANFRLVEIVEQIGTPRSLMSIIQNTTKGVPDISRMDVVEIADLTLQENIFIHAHRSSLKINRFNVYSEHTTDSPKNGFVYSSFGFGKTQTFLNMYTDFRGNVYLNLYASTNVYAENITLNMTNGVAGFGYKTQ